MSIIIMFWQEILSVILILAVMGGTLWKLYGFPEYKKVSKEQWAINRRTFK